MGNCPSGSRFRLSPTGMGCVVQCPADKGFEPRVVAGKPACVYKSNPAYRVGLQPLTMIFPQGQPNAKQTTTMEELKQSNPDLYARYKEEEERFDKEFAVVHGNIEKQTRVRDAFAALQAAENVRDQNPQAYQDARTRYYTLVKGDAWRDEERERIARAEALPKAMKFKEEAGDLQTRINQQQRTVDVVNGLKDKVLSMRDELKYSVSTFGKQLNDLKSQIQMQRRLDTQAKETPYGWLDIFINLVLVLASLVVLFVLYRRFKRTSVGQPPIQIYTSPAYGR